MARETLKSGYRAYRTEPVAHSLKESRHGAVYGDWWGIAIVAVFSLVIYYWALEVALPTEEIERMIEEVVLPEEEDLGELPAH